MLDFECYGDTSEMVTSQAGMADILLEGAINLEIPLNSGSALNRRGRDFSYTRASIVNDPRYSSGQWGDLMTDIMMGGVFVLFDQKPQCLRVFFVRPV